MSNMRKSRRRQVLLLLVLGGLSLATMLRGGLYATAQTGATFTVMNVNNSGPGSLRQAIMDSNNNPGLNTIAFNIGSGPQTIKPLQRLPTLTDPVVIDGTTQPGFSGTPIIELDFSNLVEGHGLAINGGSSTVRGLVINRSNGDGISIGFNGGNRVEGCYIGTDMTGTVARPNGINGISIPSSSNVIGGATAAARNVISGNNGVGISVSRFCCTGNESPITGNIIQGNYVGVNAAGNAAIANRREGIGINSFNSNVPVTGNVVGGTQPGAGNVVSGNRFDGVALDGFHVRNNTVQGNFIGTDSTGSFAIPNDGHGVTANGSDNLIGGSTPGARNVISGNGRNGSGVTGGNGVSLGTFSGSVVQGNVVQGNIIGANASLTGPVPNFFHGVAIGGTNSIVGGTAAGEGNVIAFNGLDGIVAASSSAVRNSLRGNSIFSNGFLNSSSNASIGIDLGGSGVTPNDAGDNDTGANNLQNFPVITSVTAGANSVNVKGTLNSTASTAFNLDFYANSVCDPLGFGEGTRLVGSAIVTSGADGEASFDLNFPVTLPPGQVLTATATDPAGNTSEFSQCSATSAAIGSVNFSPNFADSIEGTGVVSFVLNRVGGSAGTLTVNYAVVGQTATAGSDFTPTQGTLTFADGETSKMFTVPILDDNVDELSETATVTLSTSGDLDTLGSQSTATLTIIDNDPQPRVSVGDAGAAEGDSGTTNLNFPVTLSNPSSRPVTVNFNTTNGTAIGDQDYLLPTVNSVTIPAGQTSAMITIQVIGDTNVEPEEQFFVNLSSPINATVLDGQGIGTIRDDDAQPLGLQYYPLPAPVRLLDTRPGQPACVNTGIPLTANAIHTEAARTACTGIPVGAKAIVGNATVVNNTPNAAGGYLTLFPIGAAQPTVSNLNFVSGQIVPNSFTVSLGDDGAFSIYTLTETHFIVDITGYYALPDADGLYYHPLPSPVRLLDTRSGQPACDAPGVPLAGGGVRTEAARLSCGGVTIPASAQAIVGNATVVSASDSSGFITLYPNGAVQPTVSNLNYVAGQVVPNAFTVGLGSDGAFNIFASSPTDFIVDISGYYSADETDVNGTGLLYYPLGSPVRLLDTRSGEPACNTLNAPLMGDSTRTQVARGMCGGETIPVGAQAVVGNATVVHSTGSAGGYVTLYPSEAAQPTVSNLNYVPGEVVPNAFTVGLGSDGAFRIYPSTTINFIVDLTGYFAT